MAEITLESILNEQTPAEQAKALGLVYGGFGGWVNADRKVVARTIDGHLVKVDDEQETEQKGDRGRVTVLVMEDEIVKVDDAKLSKYLQKFNKMIKAIIRRGGEFVLLCNRGSERAVADYLRKNGVKAGLKLVPIVNNNPNKMREFCQKKIEEGFTNIQFFGSDDKAVHAVESLKATYNKLDIVIDTHLIAKMSKKGE
jgi:hypothetical protein